MLGQTGAAGSLERPVLPRNKVSKCSECPCVCVCACVYVFMHVRSELAYVTASVLQCVSVILVQRVAHWVQTIPGFVCMSCCHAVYCTEWALGSEACENPTLAHLETVSCVCVCVCLQKKDRNSGKECVCLYVCASGCIHVCVGWGVVGERGHSTLKQPLSVLDSTEGFFIVLLFH